MSYANEYGFGADITKIIRNKARQIVGKAGITWDDVPDIEQELATALHLALSAYEPERSAMTTFASRVVQRSVCKILRHRRQEKRGYGARVAGHYKHDAASEYRLYMEHINWAPSHADTTSLRMDVADTISRLPRDLRAVARSLATKNVTDTARSLGIPRTTIYSAIERIRIFFQGAGLEVYL